MKNLATPTLLIALAGLAGPLPAQRQFDELLKSYMPALRDTSRAVRAADFDKDGDLDLLIGNNEIISGGQDRLLRNDGKGTFTDVTATHLPAGIWHTHGFAIGDVDKDGDLDFATGDTWQNRLFLNDGTGKFTDATFGRLPVHGDETRDLLLIDVDGDLDLDLVCANYRQEKLYFNNGSGVFSDVTATNLPVDTESTWDLAAADVDGDNDLDLIFANYGKGRLYLNNGSGKFTDATAARLPGLQTNAGSVLFLDVDKDGDLDVFFGYWEAQAQLYLNNGTGTFTDATAGRLPATKPYHWEAVAGDVDGDGDLDIYYTTIYEDQLFLNDGGKFVDVSAARLPRVMSTTIDTVMTDLDGDADLDLVTADAGQLDRLFFNDGAGYFTNATPTRLEMAWVGAVALALGDLDGDKDLDLVTAGADYGEAVEDDGVLLNDGRGSFAPVPAGDFPSIKDDTQAVAVGDVDKDGDLDVVLGNLRQQSRLFRNNGSAKFTDVTATHLPAATDATTALAFGDVDKDGDLDLVVGNLGELSRLYVNDGTGKFTDATATRMPAVVRETRAVALGDMDKDGDLDIVLGNGLTRNEMEGIYVNDGSGKFADETAARMPSSAWVFPTASIALGDVDNDGDLDIGVGNDGVGLGRFNRLYVNDGGGKFTDRDLVYDYYRTFALVFGDVDGDGDLDAVCGDYDHYDKVYLNDGKGSFANWSWPRMPLTLDRTRSLALGDVDRDGDLDLIRGSDWMHTVQLTNHHRQIWSPRLAKLGTTWPLDVYAQPGYATVPQLAIPLLAAAPAAIPLSPWGTLGLEPASLLTLSPLVLPAPSGKATLPLPIPNMVDLLGKSVFWQALILHTANLGQARFSNVLAERFVK